MPNDDFDFRLLQHLTDKPAASQRGLAAQLGVSVGKVNYCLRALVARGWVKADNFRRSDRKWAYAYLLTPSGARAKLKLTRDFLDIKEREFERLQSEISALRNELRQKEPGP
jgi:EPS-associated MarR family transcriptional regulator